MAKALVDSAISSNVVMVFSKTYCPYCVMAKNSLDGELGPGKYTVMELENRKDMNSIQDYLNQITGERSVPRVFIAGRKLKHSLL